MSLFCSSSAILTYIDICYCFIFLLAYFSVQPSLQLVFCSPDFINLVIYGLFFVLIPHITQSNTVNPPAHLPLFSPLLEPFLKTVSLIFSTAILRFSTDHSDGLSPCHLPS